MTANQPAAKMPPLWIVKLRAPFFTADLVPVCLGVAIAWVRAGAFNLWYLLLTLVGAVCINAGTIQIHLMTGLLITQGYVIQGVVGWLL